MSVEEATSRSSSVRWTSSNKKGSGRKILICDNDFQYRFNRETSSSEYYYCRNKQVYGCKSSATISKCSSDKCTVTGIHNHEAERLKSMVSEVINNNIVNASKNPTVPPRNVLADITSETIAISKYAGNLLPRMNTIKQSIHRARKLESSYPPLPKNIAEDLASIPESITKLSTGENFLHANILQEDGSRILIFMSGFGKNILNKSRIWQMDGTFSTCPEGFYQLYFIFGCTKNKLLIPAAYCILPSKQEQVYSTVLTELQKAIDRPPRLIVMDFEKSMMNAIHDIFDSTNVHGCLFHWKQCLQRQLGFKGVKTLYNQNDNFQTLVNLLYVLAYVPEGDIPFAWEKVILSEYNEWKEEYPENVSDYLSYVEKTYVGSKISRNRRAPPSFPYSMWSQWSSMMDATPTTNNAVESFNRSYNLSSNRKPNLWQTIDSFKRENSIGFQKLTEITSGEYRDPNPAKKRKSEERRDNIMGLMSTYSKQNIEEYFETMIYKV